MRNNATKIIINLLMISTISILQLGHAATSKDFNCIMTDEYKDGSPGAVKTSFTPTTGEIFLLCDTKAVKKGDSLKAEWYLISSTDGKLSNLKITEKALPVEKDIPPGLVFTSNMSLSKPTNGWPAGTYRVDLYLNKDKINSYQFDVK